MQYKSSVPSNCDELVLSLSDSYCGRDERPQQNLRDSAASVFELLLCCQPLILIPCPIQSNLPERKIHYTLSATTCSLCSRPVIVKSRQSIREKTPWRPQRVAVNPRSPWLAQSAYFNFPISHLNSLKSF